jgi:hypothetical protein
MKKLALILVPAILAAGIAGFLKADDSTPPPNGGDANAQSLAAYLWNVEHAAEIAKDPELAGVQAVIQAHELMKSTKEPQVEIDWLTKTMYDTHNAAVRREIHLVLSNLYKQTGQSDKALDQLQDLMTEDQAG